MADEGLAARTALLGRLGEDKINLALAHVAEHAPGVFDAAVLAVAERRHDRLPPAGSRFRCALGPAGTAPCTTYARVTIADVLDATARGCVAHAIEALDHITGARVDWADTKALNEYEETALRITEDLRRATGRRP